MLFQYEEFGSVEERFKMITSKVPFHKLQAVLERNVLGNSVVCNDVPEHRRLGQTLFKIDLPCGEPQQAGSRQQ